MNPSEAPSPSSPVRRIRRGRAAVAGAVALGLMASLAACGGDDGGSSTSDTVPNADLVVTAVPTIRWDKPEYTAPAGEITVALVNEDTIRHDLVILDGDTKVPGLELVSKGKGDDQVGTVTLEPGTYSVFCVVPGHGGMDSALVVS